MHITLDMSNASALEIELIVAERNQMKEQKKRYLQDTVIGAPRVKEVHCLMLNKYAQQLTDTEQYRIVHVSHVPSMLSYENLLAITSLKPDYTECLTAASGIPLHPKYVASRDEMKSSTVSSFDIFLPGCFTKVYFKQL